MKSRLSLMIITTIVAALLLPGVVLSRGKGVAGTIPAAFTDYYVSTDGNTWTKVLRGHPKAGQFIKRMN